MIACGIFVFCLVFGFIGPTCLIRGLISFTERPPFDDDGSVDYLYGFYLIISILFVSNFMKILSWSSEAFRLRFLAF